MEKPECKACDEKGFDSQFAAELLYALFNPFHNEQGSVSIEEFIKNHLDSELKEQYEMFSHLFNDLLRSFGYIIHRGPRSLKITERPRKRPGRK